MTGVHCRTFGTINLFSTYNVSGSDLCALHVLTHLLLDLSYEAGTVSISLLQRRETESIAQGHKTGHNGRPTLSGSTVILYSMQRKAPKENLSIRE